MKKFLKLATLVVIMFGSFTVARADEGMWLPSVISHTRLKDMQSKGFKLTAEDLYSVNQASLKDAIVTLGGCTGELLSSKGLFLTNHHCAMRQIQFHSTIEHDYLTNGFSAMSLEEELPTDNYSASFLKRMDDVTVEVMVGITAETSLEEAEEIKKENIKKLIAKATKGNGFNATVEAMYYTNQYFIFVYQKFTDVRLVLAPPSSIGKFGGETDNWMWPRHTGDFSMFRIYADSNNNPAAYSKDNVPYTPKRSLKISLKGVKEGDFAFIYGYPGRTNEYLHSAAVKYIVEKSNPHKIALRDYRLEKMIEKMEQDPAVRIKYAAKKASVANAWKKWQGESRGVVKLKAVEKKEAFEKEFIEWAKDKPEYANVVQQFQALYNELEKYAFAMDYYKEGYNGIEITKSAKSYSELTIDKLEDGAEKLKISRDLFYKNYDSTIDIEITKEMLKRYVAEVNPEFVPEVVMKHKSKMDAYVNTLFAKSIFADQDKIDAVLMKSSKEAIEIINADPAISLQKEFAKVYAEKILKEYKRINTKITSLYKYYMKGMMEMQSSREFYPDANSTLRIAYGKVSGANPKDGVHYLPQSTLEGIIQKDNPEIYDYNIPQILRDIHANKDYGMWEVDGTIPVCFIASNHTTGGNSGSPVLNANGELIGLNFDRMWEATMSDIIFSEEMCRNIAVDIRYVLFLTDKVCGAGYLIDEMVLVK